MRGSGKIRAVGVAGLIIGCSAVLTASPALSAAPPAGYMQAPPSVYGEIDQDLLFAGPDPYIGYDRTLEIEGADPSTDCDHGTSATDGELGFTGQPSASCATVQLEVNHGTLTFPGANSGDGGGLPSGAEILSATVLPNPIFNIFGTVDELNGALATLTYTPDPGYESTTGSDGPDTLLLSIIDGAGDQVVLVDGSNEVVGDGDIEIAINIEQPNDPPDLTIDIPAGLRTFAASTNPGSLDSHVIRSTDPGVTIDLTDPDIDDGEPDDYMLGVAWIDGTGRFGLGFQSAVCVGAPADLVTVAACPSVPANLQPIAELLPDLPSGLNFGTTPSDYNEAIAFVAERSTVLDLLSYIDYETPATDADDTINVLVHDLGNNGLPLKPNLIEGLAVPDPLGFDFASFDITVRDDQNDPPVVTAPAATSVDIGSSIAVPFSVTDSDAGDGTLTASIVGTGVTPSATNLSGDLASLNSQLAALTATGTAAGPGSVTVTVDDGGNTPPPAEQGSASVPIDVIDPNATTTTTESTTTTTEPTTTTTESTTTTTEPTTTTESTTTTTEPTTTTTESTTTTTEPTTTTTESTTTTTEPTTTTTESTTTTTEPTTTTESTTTTSEPTTTTTDGSTTTTTDGSTTTSEVTTTTDPSTTSSTPTTSTTTAASSSTSSSPPGSSTSGPTVGSGGTDQGPGGSVGEGTLPRTGSSPAMWLMWGFSLIGLGAVVLVSRRRALARG